MNEEGWRIVPKNFTLKERRDFPMLTYVRREKGRAGSFILYIPPSLRRKSKYHKNNRKAYCNLLEKGASLKIQWISEDQAKQHTRIVTSGQLSLPPAKIESYIEKKERIRVSYKLENGNIIIDRKALGHAEELERPSSSNGQERVLKKEIAKTLKRSAEIGRPPTKGIRKCHNCLEEITLSRNGLDKDYRGATMVGKWMFWHLPGQCPKNPDTNARFSATQEKSP